MTLASFRDVVVTSNGYPLIAGATFTLDEAAIYVVTGANGAGKTSVLRLIAGLESPVRGAASVLGFSFDDRGRREVRRRVGWLGHEGSWYDELTAAENLRFGARVLSISEAEVEQALARVGLSDKRDVLAKRLSAGQRRRLGLAWLVARRPPLWILDEPFASLDALGRDVMASVLRDAVAAGATVVFSSHGAEAEFADARTLRVVGGEVLA